MSSDFRFSRPPWIALPVLLMGGIYFLSSQSGATFPFLSPSTVSDKVLHVIAYAIVVLSFVPFSGGRPPRRWLPFAMGTAFVFGALDELHQIPVPGRFFEFGDLVANLLGSLVGGVIAWLHWTVRARRRTLDGKTCDADTLSS